MSTVNGREVTALLARVLPDLDDYLPRGVSGERAERGVAELLRAPPRGEKPQELIVPLLIPLLASCGQVRRQKDGTYAALTGSFASTVTAGWLRAQVSQTPIRLDLSGYYWGMPEGPPLVIEPWSHPDSIIRRAAALTGQAQQYLSGSDLGVVELYCSVAGIDYHSAAPEHHRYTGLATAGTRQAALLWMDHCPVDGQLRALDAHRELDAGAPHATAPQRPERDVP